LQNLQEYVPHAGRNGHKMDISRLIAVYVSHKEAPLDKLEKAREGARRLLDSHPDLRYVELYTCNRYEVYLDTSDDRIVNALADAIERAVGMPPGIVRGWQAVERIMRIASGLESKIVGEPEILVQVREAWLGARDNGRSSALLDLVFHHAIATGRSVRKTTCLGQDEYGYPAAAVEYIVSAGLPEEPKILLVGSGKAARSAAKLLCRRIPSASISVYSEHDDSLQRLIRECKCCRPYMSEPSRYHAAIIATGSNYDLSWIPSRVSGPIVDISVPPRLADDKTVTIEDLEVLIERRNRKIEHCIAEAETIIERGVERLRLKLEDGISQALDAVFSVAMRMARQEAEVIARKYGIPQEEAEYYTERLAKRIVHPIVKAIGEAYKRGVPADIIVESVLEGLSKSRVWAGRD